MWRRFAPVAVVCVLIGVCQDAPCQAPAPAKQRVDAVGDPLPDGAIARLGSTRFRLGTKQLLGMSVDGKTLLLHGSGAVHWMDIATGKISKTVRYRDGAAVAGAPRGQQAQGAVLSGDSKVLVFVDESDNTFGIMDATTGKELKRIKAGELFKNGGQANQCRFQLSHDGKLLVVTGDRNVQFNTQLVWVDATTGQRLHAVDAKNGRWAHAQLSRDGKQVVASASVQGNKGQEARIHIFDTASAKEIRALDVDGANNQQREFHFSLRNDGKTLIGWWVEEYPSGQKAEPVRLYDMTAEKQLKQVHPLGDISFGGSLVLSADSKHAFIRNGGTIVDWDVDGGKQQRTIDLTLGNNDGDRFGRSQYRPPPALSPDGKLLAAAGSKAVAVYDLANNKQLTPQAAGGAIGLVRFAPDGQTLVTGTDSNSNWLWDVKQAKLLRKLIPPPDANPMPDFRGDFFSSLFGAAAFSQDGKLVALGMGDRGVDVWDTVSGKHLHHLGGEKNMDRGGGAPGAFAFAPHGSMLATAGSDGVVRLWNATTGKEVRQWTWHQGDNKNSRNDSGMLGMVFSPDGKTLVGSGFASLGGDREGATVLIFWETATGRERLRLRSTFDIGGGEQFAMIALIFDQFAMSMTFSPDGKTLALGSFTNFHLIDATTGKDVRTYSGRLCIGKTATFSRDGKRLFLGRYDGGLRVLDVATGRTIRDVAGHDEAIFAMSLSPDGKTLASGSVDATVLLWDVAEITRPMAVDKTVVAVKQLETLWNDLADNNAAKAFQAIIQLTAVPAEAVPLLKAKLKPIPAVEAKVLDKLFQDLDSEKFTLRDKATIELEKLGDLALGELQKRLAQNPTLEMRQRMEKVLAKLLGPVTSSEMMQQLRAVEALEKMGTPEALAVLEALAKGAPGHRVTEDARESAKRLKEQGR